MVQRYNKLSLFAFLAATANAAGDYVYGYTTEEQAEWQNLDDKSAVCGTGTQQSPIDLSTSDNVLSLSDIQDNNSAIDYQTLYTLIDTNIELTIPDIFKPDVSIGTHDVKVTTGDTDGILTTYSADYKTGDINEWYLNQFHFHTPSEHTIDGEYYDFEMHMVHFNKDGSKALVLGVLFDTSDDVASPFLDQFDWGESEVSAFILDLQSFIDDIGLENRWNYHGSLTTPPCLEIINWNVVRNPVQMSVAQLDQYKSYFGGSSYIGNSREIQDANGREVNLIKQSTLMSQFQESDMFTTLESNSTTQDGGLTEEENWAIDRVIITCLLVLIALIYVVYFGYMLMNKQPAHPKKTDGAVDDESQQQRS